MWLKMQQGIGGRRAAAAKGVQGFCPQFCIGHAARAIQIENEQLMGMCC